MAHGRWPLRNVCHSSITSARTTSSEVGLNVKEHVSLLDTCHLTTGLGCDPTCLIFSLGSQNEGRTMCFFIQDMCWTQTPKDQKNGPISPASHSAQAMRANTSFSRKSRCLQPKASLPFPHIVCCLLTAPEAGWCAVQQVQLWSTLALLAQH